LYQIKKSMANTSLQMRLYLRWFSTMVIVVFGMSVPFMRIVLGVSSSLVMFYSVCLGLAVVFAGLVSKNFADRLGSKPLSIFSSLFSIICLLLWAMLPHEVSYLWFFLLGFFTNFFLSLVSLLVVRLVAQVMPDDEAVSFNSMVNFVIAIFALAAGFLSGLMANMSDVATHIFSISGRFIGNPYTLVFLFALGMDVIVLVLSSRLQEVGSYSTHDAAAVVFSLHGLQAVSMIEKLSKTVDPTKRRALLLALGSNLNNIATSEMREILAYPFSPDKEDAIRSLGEKPRKALLDDLIKIAVDDDSYVQLEAIAALGSYKGEDKARQALVNLLHGHWSSVRSMASRSLARMTMGPEYLEEINQLSLSARHIDEEIDFLIAKRNMDKEGLFYKDFFLSVLQKRSASFRQTRYAVLASFLKFGSPRLARLYEEMNNGDVDDFLTDFLTEAKDLPQIDENYAMIFDAFSKNDWGAVRTFCLGMLDICDVSFNSSFENLRLGILKAREMDIACFDIQDALAELYFCYSLEKNSRK